MYEALTALLAILTLLGSGVAGYFRMQTVMRNRVAAVDEKLDRFCLDVEHRLTMLEARNPRDL